MQDLVRQLLVALGEDPSREGLAQTPKRVEDSSRFLTSGYQADVDKVLNGALFTVGYSEMVIVSRISISSACASTTCCRSSENATSATLPDKKVVGISKIARLVDMFSRRLQVQERLTTQIAQDDRGNRSGLWASAL